MGTKEPTLKRAIVRNTNIQHTSTSQDSIGLVARGPWIPHMLQDVIDDDQVKRFRSPWQGPRIANATVEPKGTRIGRQRCPWDVDTRALPASTGEIPQQVPAATPHIQDSRLPMIQGRRLLAQTNYSSQQCWPHLGHGFHAGHELAAALAVVLGRIRHILGRNVSEAHEAALLAHA